MNKAWVILAISFFITGCGKDYNGENDKSRSEDSYQWMTGKLIPNEFGLPEGTWSDSTIHECITKCSADKNCFGFSGNFFFDGFRPVLKTIFFINSNRDR